MPTDLPGANKESSMAGERFKPYELDNAIRRLNVEVERLRGLKSNDMVISNLKTALATARAENAVLRKENKLLHKLLEDENEKPI